MAFRTPAEALAYFSELQTGYRLTFNAATAHAVVADLTRFCRARETCVVPGDRDKTFVLEGRREVFLRIQDFLERTPEELVALYTTQPGGKTDDRAETPQGE